jgi:hypothetical protein
MKWLVSSYITLLLLGRSCGNYFAAVRLSSSGQSPESYLQLRACIESALYAFNIYSDPKLAKIWINRHKNAQSRRDSQNSFKPSLILNKLIQANHSLGQKVKKDYERCIDYGAHPVERSVSSNLSITREKISIKLLNTTDGILQACLLACVICGLDAIKVFNLIYPNDFNKFNVELRIQAIQDQFGRTAPEVSYKLKAKKF